MNRPIPKQAQVAYLLRECEREDREQGYSESADVLLSWAERIERGDKGLWERFMSGAAKASE